MFTAEAKKKVEIGRIVYTKSDGTSRVYDLTRNISIGRGQDCDIRIKQGTVSRLHCNITREDGGPLADSGCAGIASGGGEESTNSSSGQEERSEVVRGEYYIENVSTTNMTEINYVATWGKTKLNNNDIITIGERDFVFKAVMVEMTLDELNKFLNATLLRLRQANGGSGSESEGDDAGTASPAPFQKTAEADSAGCIPFINSSPPIRREQIRSPKPVPKSSNTLDASSVWSCIPVSIIAGVGAGAGDSAASVIGDVDDVNVESSVVKEGRSVRFSSNGHTTRSTSGHGGSSKTTLTPEQRDEKRKARAEQALKSANESLERIAHESAGAKQTNSGGGSWLWFF